MHEGYSLNIETFDPDESITLPNVMPVPQRPPLSETITALCKAFAPSATIGFTMREAQAVGLICQRGTRRERLARRALRVVGFFRHFRKHPKIVFTDLFKDRGRSKITQRCRNVAGFALGVDDPCVREALCHPMKDLQAGESTASFDVYRKWIAP